MILSKVLTSLVRDTHFWLAVLVAPVAWWCVHYFVPVSEIVVPSPKLVLLALIYPIIEELAFRGGIQGTLQYLLKEAVLFNRISLANIITSLLFTLLHILYHATFWALLVFLPSLIFGYFRDKYHSTYPSIFLHIYYNIGYFLLSW